ncbi:MAG: ribosome maturation factor RimM [Rhodoferax sp.]|nr:ribosome maturation factor RimM [Rhodoferax sp.]
MLPGLEPAELPADAIEVGRIGEAWGVQGWFKVLPYSADPQALFSSKRWFLVLAGQGSVFSASTFLLKVKQAKSHSDGVVACAQEIDDRNAAEALRGASVHVPRSSFPTLQQDEYYWTDVIGLSVVNREGVALGQVRELLATGAQTVLVIEYLQDGKLQERMIPFVAVFVDNVDLVARRITVDWQPDY